jgi:hypothetical protein
MKELVKKALAEKIKRPEKSGRFGQFFLDY